MSMYGKALGAIGIATAALTSFYCNQAEVENLETIREKRVNKFEQKQHKQIIQEQAMNSSDDDAQTVIILQNKLEKMKQKQQDQLNATIDRRAKQQIERDRLIQEKNRLSQMTSERVNQIAMQQRQKQFDEDERVLQEIMKRRGQ